MIEVRNLTRSYAEFTAVDRISFSVGEGEIVGMLGPNGAGKTTTIRMITGFLPPSSGTVTIAGRDLQDDPRGARRQVGYLPENVALYPEMRVAEYLWYRAMLVGMRRSEARENLGEVIESCFLTGVRNQIIGTLSKGYRQRVGLAAAILHRPPVLVLDEPTVGLDPRQIVAIRELIRELGRSRTLLLSSHILPEVELICDRVVIIDEGRIIAEGTPESLRQSGSGNRHVRVELKDDPEAARAALGDLDGILAVSAGDRPGRYRLEFGAGIDPREAVFGLMVERGWVLLELQEDRASLEDIFVRLTTRESMNGSERDSDRGAREVEE